MSQPWFIANLISASPGGLKHSPLFILPLLVLRFTVSANLAEIPRPVFVLCGFSLQYNGANFLCLFFSFQHWPQSSILSFRHNSENHTGRENIPISLV